MFRQAHNSFSPPEMFEKPSESKGEKESENFHFIAYVPHAGDNDALEIDGLQKCPYLYAAEESASWISTALRAIQRRIERYFYQINV